VRLRLQCDRRIVDRRDRQRVVQLRLRLRLRGCGRRLPVRRAAFLRRRPAARTPGTGARAMPAPARRRPPR